jgi:UDP-N-acetyl-D-mannosaminuronic acid dehydrogenase
VPYLQRNLVINHPPRTTVAGRADLDGGRSVDFWLCYSPERVLPGQILRELVENARVIGGVDAQAADGKGNSSAEAGRALYATFVRGEIVLTDATTAEMVKLMENTYRDVNIAIANEFSRLAERFGVDVWEAIAYANRHPRVKILRPGPGVGGHCISVDPWFFVEAAPDLATLIHTARLVNDGQPQVAVKLVQRAMGNDLAGKRIAVLGLAYKPDVDDLRESPAIEVARSLAAAGAQVLAYEPFKPEAQIEGLQLAPTLEAALKEADALLLMVGHASLLELEPAQVLQMTPARLAIDCVGGWSAQDWQAAGFQFCRLGDGKYACKNV